jgi:hypothetical protein
MVRPGAFNNQCLFLSEAECARLHGQRLPDWKQRADILERDGFPKIHPLMGGRFKPAIIAWWNRHYGLSSIQVSQPDGEENLDAL